MNAKKKAGSHLVPLERKEKDLLESFEHGEWKSVKDIEKEMVVAKRAAVSYLKKNACILRKLLGTFKE